MCDEKDAGDIREEIGDDEKLKSADEIQAQNDHTPFFKLNIDCLYEIFDYLSLGDIQTFGRMCKTLQQLAGEYFTQNYVTEAYIDPKDIEYPGVVTRLSDFNKFVQNLLFTTMTRDTRSLKKISWYAANNYNHKLKRIRFYEVNLTGAEIQNLHNTWQHLKSVVIEDCVVNQKFYDQFPKLCPNLKRLYIKVVSYRRNVLRRTGNEWLLNKYQNLEHFHWTQTQGWRRIHELNTFFKLNPNLRSFTIDIESFWRSKEAFIESEIQLIDLTIDIGKERDECPDFNSIYLLLNELHLRGGYKRLHINLEYYRQSLIDQMIPLYALKSLCVGTYTNDYSGAIALPHWMNLVELKVSLFSHVSDFAAVVGQMVNLKRVYFQRIELENALKFLYYSVKLKQIKIKSFYADDENSHDILDLAAVNREREKLEGASKVTVYGNERVYLATKWATNGSEFSLVEIRRDTSDEWGHNFIPFY